MVLWTNVQEKNASRFSEIRKLNFLQSQILLLEVSISHCYQMLSIMIFQLSLSYSSIEQVELPETTRKVLHTLSLLRKNFLICMILVFLLEENIMISQMNMLLYKIYKNLLSIQLLVDYLKLQLMNTVKFMHISCINIILYLNHSKNQFIYH